jgi:L-threonylcarbamoyladenylate synthase
MNEKIYIYPTDTVWGIGCHIESQNGFEQIALIKQTSRKKPLSILFTNREEIFNYFNFNERFTKDEFSKISALGVSYLIPKEKCILKIPLFYTELSEYISVRLIENSEELNKLRLEIGAPFYTTSLNITGMNPITSQDEAQKFCNDLEIKTEFVKCNQLTLSGVSSTIIKFDLNWNVSIVRKGLNQNKILEILK